MVLLILFAAMPTEIFMQQDGLPTVPDIIMLPNGQHATLLFPLPDL